MKGTDIINLIQYLLFLGLAMYFWLLRNDITDGLVCFAIAKCYSIQLDLTDKKQ